MLTVDDETKDLIRASSVLKSVDTDWLSLDPSDATDALSPVSATAESWPIWADSCCPVDTTLAAIWSAVWDKAAAMAESLLSSAARAAAKVECSWETWSLRVAMPVCMACWSVACLSCRPPRFAVSVWIDFSIGSPSSTMSWRADWKSAARVASRERCCASRSPCSFASTCAAVSEMLLERSMPRCACRADSICPCRWARVTPVLSSAASDASRLSASDTLARPAAVSDCRAESTAEARAAAWAL